MAEKDQKKKKESSSNRNTSGRKEMRAEWWSGKAFRLRDKNVFEAAQVGADREATPNAWLRLD